MILAAIDIGSNAIRLLISQVEVYDDDSVDYTKLTLLRIPLRLGFEVFEQGIISPEKESQLIDAMKAYKLLMNIYKVEAFRACATSAMRDAKNGQQIIKDLYAQTGIKIDIISGQEEANIIYETHIAEKLEKDKAYLYVDVGGGSTEVTLFAKNKIVFKESFNIGTIRMLNDTVSDEAWNQMKRVIKSQTEPFFALKTIGSGGNINKIFSISKKKEGKPLTLDLLKEYYRELNASTVAERMHLYNLRADRADVIVPALQIFIAIMRWSGSEEVFVPRIGLADGLIKMQYAERIFGK